MMPLAVLVLLGIGWLERALLKHRPDLLGAIAWLPLEVPRRLAVSGRAADALTAVDAPAGYREPAPMRLDRSRLPARTEVRLSGKHSGDAVAIIDLREGLVTVAISVEGNRWTGGSTRAVARLRVDHEGDTLRLRGRWTAIPLISMLVMLALVTVMARGPHVWFGVAIVLGVIAFAHIRGRRTVREAVQQAVAEVERQLGASQ